MTTQADHIISKSRGINALARMLGHKHSSTVQGWKERGYVPPRQWQNVAAAWDAAGIEWDAADFVKNLIAGPERHRELKADTLHCAGQ